VLAGDGVFYVSYGKEPGPNSMTDGAIWKYNPRNGAWTDITPVKPAGSGQPFGYGAVAVDAQRPSTLMATTFCHWQEHDEIFRSTNAGLTWTQLWNEKTEWDHSSAPYTKSRNPHWMGDIQINPFDSDQVLFTTGYGIWACVNATHADSGRPTRWVFLNEGLEETVPLVLISPPEGANLLSGLGDIDGFCHDDLAVSPPETFAGPRFANTEDMAFAARKPQFIVRVGTIRQRPGQLRGAYSLDGGKSWKALASEPPNSEGAGSIAVAANGQRIVWAPRRSAPHWSSNLGSDWQTCSGLVPGMRVVADTVNPHTFYAYDQRSDRVMVSTNGAATFSKTAADLSKVVPRAEAEERRGERARLYAVPGHEGHLWLAFHGGGLLNSRDRGETFAKIGAFGQCDHLGFGKGAPSQVYPALYLAGRIGKLRALWRSDDIGRSWVRIDDDQHRFGAFRCLTADARIYGRVYLGTEGRGIIYGDPVVPGTDKTRLKTMQSGK
jgi:hypothetical protein